MKKFLSILLLMALLLSGCTKPGSPATEPSETQTQPSTTAPEDPSTEPSTEPSTDSTEPTQPEEPEPRPNYGLYEEGSQIEISTNGAVKKFLLEQEDCFAVLPVGDGLMVFSGEGDTVMTLYREDREPASITAEESWIYPDDMVFRINDRGAAYFHDAQNTVEFVNFELEQIDSIELPEDMEGNPAITEDWSRIYYTKAGAVYYVDVVTGISKLLKESSSESISIAGLHFSDSVLECVLESDDLDVETVYLSAQTGELLSSTKTLSAISTDEQWYFAQYFDSVYTQLLFGKRGGTVQSLVPLSEGFGLYALPQIRSVVIYDDAALELYDLTDGTRASSVSFEGIEMPWGIVEASNPQRIWFLAADVTTGKLDLYCWDPTLSPTGDADKYIEPYYTQQDPDTEGLAQIKEQAKELGNKYGVKIKIHDAAVTDPPSDYTFTSEYRVPIYEHYLPILDQVLGAYPEGFLKKLGKRTSDNEKLTICLVAGAYDDNDAGALSTADGVQYILDGNFYLALVMNDFMETTAYHEIYHAIDIYVLGQVSTFDFWDTLNPDGFRYDNDYLTNQNRDDYQYLEDDERYFIDMYSMSFAKEDRARIMEYAMQPGNESYFTSEHMQAKLKMLCKGIREAFGMKKYDGDLIWEQYLED